MQATHSISKTSPVLTCFNHPDSRTPDLLHRDDRHFARLALSAGTSLGRLPEKNAALGAGLKVSTGTLFWNGGVRVPLQPPCDAMPRKTSFFSRLRYGAQQAEGGKLEGTSISPSGVSVVLSPADARRQSIHEARRRMLMVPRRSSSDTTGDAVVAQEAGGVGAGRHLRPLPRVIRQCNQQSVHDFTNPSRGALNAHLCRRRRASGCARRRWRRCTRRRWRAMGTPPGASCSPRASRGRDLSCRSCRCRSCPPPQVSPNAHIRPGAWSCQAVSSDPGDHQGFRGSSCQPQSARGFPPNWLSAS